MQTKLGRLDRLLDDRDLASVWFGRPNTFAWLLGGSNVVSDGAAVGVAAVGYDGDGLTVVTDNIEAPRLRAEELPDGVAVESADWYAADLGEAVAERSPTPAAADFDVPGFESVDAGDLRQPLTEADVAAYRELGRDTAAAVESVCRDLDPGDTERAVAGRLAGVLAERSIAALVVLVGGAERAQQYRHYTPSDAELGEYALVSVTARRAGLHASCTRTVAFDPLSWLDDRHATATRVETSALAATREVGREDGVASDVFERIQSAYAALDRPDEWRAHHQGGAAGYAGREWIATPTLDAPVRLPMGYAWNPTVQGAKSEDTVLVTDEGFEPLTTTGEWPTRTAEAVGADVELERHGVLRL
ncbi:M24 family metallopeptidase [Halococcus agarilyticus]|uniref:M24 family metallopeptidase n=1 Tax=Halococcus agarilyticus TaxID=1232219 RepID=UPI000677C6DD|nr:M24 family metallopeptidase [Halococcus agarilyticus]